MTEQGAAGFETADRTSQFRRELAELVPHAVAVHAATGSCPCRCPVRSLVRCRRIDPLLAPAGDRPGHKPASLEIAPDIAGRRRRSPRSGPFRLRRRDAETERTRGAAIWLVPACEVSRSQGPLWDVGTCRPTRTSSTATSWRRSTSSNRRCEAPTA